MALEDEIKKKKAEDALIASGSAQAATADEDPEPDTSDDSEDKSTDTEEKPAPVYGPSTKSGPSYVLVPFKAPVVSSPEAPLTVPAPTPESPSQPADIKTDTDTGARYVTDADTGKPVPHAELATPADEEAFKPGDVTLPKVDVAGASLDKGEAPAQLTQVERATLVKLPAPDLGERGASILEAPKATLVDPDPDEQYLESDKLASATVPPEIISGKPVPEAIRSARNVPSATQPAPQPLPVTGGEGFWGGDLSQGAPGAPPADGTEDRPFWPKADKDVKLLPPGSNYIDPHDQSVKTTPGTFREQSTQPTTAASSVTPPPRQTSLGLTPDEYKAQMAAPAATSTAGGPTPDASNLNINTDYQADSNSSAKGRAGDGQIHGIILHSSDGRESGDLNQLTHGGVSAHYYVTTDGRIYNLVPDGDTAYHAGQTRGQYANYNNSNTIGIEQEHYDPGDKGGKNGEAWSPAQVAATAKLVAYLKGKYGLSDNDIMGHSDIAPERKQDPYNYPWQGFFKAVDGASAASAGAQARAASGKGAADSGGSFISGKATNFGYNDPDDNGVGAPKLGGLSTNNTSLVGIAVPQAALQAYVGAHPASWRTARVEVVTGDNRHLLVPIVDLGPKDTSDQRGVVADFTEGLARLTGNTADQNYQFRIIPNAGPDVMKDPQGFADEQAAIRAGVNTAARFQPPAKKGPSYVLAPLSGAESASADTARALDTQGQTDTLTQLAGQNPNIVGLYKRLDKDVPGVAPAMRQQFQANLKPQIIGMMKQTDPSLSDDQAWAKAQTDPNALDVGADFWNKFVGSFQQLQPLLQQATGVGAEQSHLDSFLSQALPNGSDADKHALLSKLYALPPEQRGPAVASMIPNPQAGVPGQDPQQVVSALDRLSDPNYAKQQAAQMAQAQAALKQRMATDPRLADTPAAFASENLAQIPEMLAAASIPPLMAAQISSQVRDQLKAQHPEYSEDELDQKAAYSTLVQFVGQEAAGRLFSAGAGALLQGVTSPVKRAIAQALIQTGAGAAISGGAQAGSNIVTGEPIEQGVGSAMASGAIMGGASGAVHGAGELLHPAEAPLGQEPVTPPPTTGQEGAPVRGATDATLTKPVAAADVTGPDVPDTSVPWYKPGPIVTRGEERTTFTPSELAQAVRGLPEGTTGEVAQAAENLQPPVDFTQRGVFLNSTEAQQAEINKANAVQAPQMEAIRNLVQQGATPEEAVARVRQSDQGLPGTSSSGATVLPPEAKTAMTSVGEAEPWVSKIANRFTVERMAAGDLGTVQPGVGVTKEEMLARGLQMGPETINQHVSNVMNDVGGNPRDQAAAIRTEEARLSQRSRDASLASEANPQNQQLRADADNAFKDLTDFHNGPVAKLKSNWHAQGMTLQGELPVDLSTYNGLRDAYLRDVGKPPPANAEPVMRRTAKAVRDASAAESEAVRNLGREIDRQSARRPLPSADQVRDNIMRRMKIEPCPI
jgi:N-acetylmuramoyl-L-alanine amidase